MMEDGIKPCIKCGGMERYGVSGRCKLCLSTQRKTRRAMNSGYTNKDLILKPCIKCGSLKRYKSGNCISCQQARNKDYYLLHKEECKLRNARYIECNREKRKAYMTEYRRENDNYIRKRRRDYYLSNTTKILEYQALYGSKNRERRTLSALRRRHKTFLAKRLVRLSDLQHRITTEAPK